MPRLSCTCDLVRHELSHMLVNDDAALTISCKLDSIWSCNSVDLRSLRSKPSQCPRHGRYWTVVYHHDFLVSIVCSFVVASRYASRGLPSVPYSPRPIEAQSTSFAKSGHSIKKFFQSSALSVYLQSVLLKKNKSVARQSTTNCRWRDPDVELNKYQRMSSIKTRHPPSKEGIFAHA